MNHVIFLGCEKDREVSTFSYIAMDFSFLFLLKYNHFHFVCAYVNYIIFCVKNIEKCPLSHIAMDFSFLFFEM